MSNFSRNKSRKSKSSKNQLIMVVLLAGGLAGAVAFNWNSFKPRSAEASFAGHGSDNPLLPESGVSSMISPEAASQAVAALSHDPTANLLRGTISPLADLDQPPANPFALSTPWRSLLVHPTVVPKIAVVASTPQPHAAPAFNTDQIKIQGAMKIGSKNMVIINGAPMGAGSVVSGARIVDVLADRVILQPLNAPEGSRVEIPLK